MSTRNEKSGISHVTKGRVFDDLGFNAVESAALELRTDIYSAIMKVIQKRGYKPRDIEKTLDVPQPRVSELLTGKISKMSLEKLITYAARLGLKPNKLSFSSAKTSQA